MPSCGRTRATAATSARTTPAGPSVGTGCTGRPRHSQRRVNDRTGSIARTFDRVVALLDEIGYLDGDTVTADGERLTRLYTEMDLVAAEALRQGLWRGLTPAELAAAVSVLVYEARRDPGAPPKLPGGAGRTAIEETLRLARRPVRPRAGPPALGDP